MRNEIRKRLGKRFVLAMISASDMLSNVLKLLAIPAGFEPATIGLEGPKQSPEFCGFEDFKTVNRTRLTACEFALAVNGPDHDAPPQEL